MLLFVILLLGVPGFALAEPTPPSGIKILLPGEFHPKEVDADSGEVWLVLYKRNGEYRTELRPIRIEACRDMGDSPGQKTGKRVASDVDGEAVLFVKGLDPMASGPVAVAPGTPFLLYPGQEKSIKLPNDEWSNFYAIGRAEMRRLEDQEVRGIADYGISYSRTPYDQHQTLGLFSVDSESHPPVIEWAGDIDRDGHADLLIQRSSFNAGEWMLYLSSAAVAPALLQLVATRVHIGC